MSVRTWFEQGASFNVIQTAFVERLNAVLHRDGVVNGDVGVATFL